MVSANIAFPSSNEFKRHFHPGRHATLWGDKARRRPWVTRNCTQLSTRSHAQQEASHISYYFIYQKFYSKTFSYSPTNVSNYIQGLCYLQRPKQTSEKKRRKSERKKYTSDLFLHFVILLCIKFSRLLKMLDLFEIIIKFLLFTNDKLYSRSLLLAKAKTNIAREKG